MPMSAKVTFGKVRKVLLLVVWKLLLFVHVDERPVWLEVPHWSDTALPSTAIACTKLTTGVDGLTVDDREPSLTLCNREVR